MAKRGAFTARSSTLVIANLLYLCSFLTVALATTVYEPLSEYNYDDNDLAASAFVARLPTMSSWFKEMNPPSAHSLNVAKRWPNTRFAVNKKDAFAITDLQSFLDGLLAEKGSHAGGSRMKPARFSIGG